MDTLTSSPVRAELVEALSFASSPRPAAEEQYSPSTNSGQSKIGESIINGLSVDVEDWFQVGAFEGTIRRADWDGLDCRVEANCERILALFDRLGVKATFFVLGWVAARYPATIRRIADAGHEVASHGWDHARVFKLDAAGFAADLYRTRQTLEDISGQPVTGYRAPSFSIDARNPWAHRVLAEQGYRYSSSVAPVANTA